MATALKSTIQYDFCRDGWHTLNFVVENRQLKIDLDGNNVAQGQVLPEKTIIPIPPDPEEEKEEEKRKLVAKLLGETYIPRPTGPKLRTYDFGNKLYFGGYPRDHDLFSQIKEDVRPFGGCFRQVSVDSYQLDLFNGVHALNVDLDGCPPVHDSKCPDDEAIEEIFFGKEHEFIDNTTSQLPFSRYIYKVSITV